MREIQIDIKGYTARASQEFAGVRGEANATSVRLRFDKSWEGLSKKVTWWDARGQNPVELLLPASSAEGGPEAEEYLSAIPGEPLKYGGLCTMVADGFRDGVRARSAALRLKVAEAPVSDGAGQPFSPSLGLGEQLQAQVDSLLGDIRFQADRAVAAGDGALLARSAAEQAKSDAEGFKAQAEEQAEMAMYYHTMAETAREQAQAYQLLAQRARNEANQARDAARAAQAAAEAARDELLALRSGPSGTEGAGL